MLPLAAWAVRRLEGRWRGALLGLGLVSTAIQLLFVITEPEIPEDVVVPLRDFVIPRVITGRFRPTVLGAAGAGRAAAVALAVVLCAAAWTAASRCRGCCGPPRVVSWRRTINHGDARRRIP